LDEAAARHAKENAERLLANRVDAVEIAQAQVELLQAVAQLQAIERLRKQLRH
ncbi:MAG: ATP synthase delta/epsilon chain alpha-helix domain-containing protein, partial [Rudaea sp.]